MEKERIDWAKYEKKHRYYLTRHWDDKRTKWVAIISLGHARKVDKTMVLCAIEMHDTPVECDKWYQDQLLTKPWKREGNDGISDMVQLAAHEILEFDESTAEQ